MSLSASSCRVHVLRPSGAWLQAMLVSLASASPSSLRALRLAWGLCLSDSTAPRSTAFCRVFSTWCAVKLLGNLSVFEGSAFLVLISQKQDFGPASFPCAVSVGSCYDFDLLTFFGCESDNILFCGHGSLLHSRVYLSMQTNAVRH
jgi:hypothetical protein